MNAPERVAASAAPLVDNRALDAIREIAGTDTPDLLANILGLYLDDAPRLLAAIAAAWAQRDAPALAVAAHALKSSSASMGAVRLSLMCKTLEFDAQVDDLTDAEPLMGALGGVWEATREQLEAAIR